MKWNESSKNVYIDINLKKNFSPSGIKRMKILSLFWCYVIYVGEFENIFNENVHINGLMSDDDSAIDICLKRIKRFRKIQETYKSKTNYRRPLLFTVLVFVMLTLR